MSNEQSGAKRGIFESLGTNRDNKQPPLSDDEGDGGLYFSGDIPRSKASPSECDAATPVLSTSRGTSTTPMSELHTPNFFDHKELITTDAITERIIPTDHSSPGARTAGVAGFIDRFLAASPSGVQTIWREGLATINNWCRDRFGVDFPDLGVSDQDSVLNEISSNEAAPHSAEEIFFVVIKRMTWDVYYRSEIGIHYELKYRGNSYQRDFEGCNHPEHM